MSASWVLLHADPSWFAALAGVAALALAGGFLSSRGVSPARRSVLLGLRLITVALAALAVLRPAREVDLVRAKRAPLAVVVDRSASMELGPEPMSGAVSRWLDDAGGELAELERFYRVEVFGLDEPDGPAGSDDAGTNRLPLPQSLIGSTLERLTRADAELAAVVLLSDGRDTQRPGEPPVGLDVPVYPVVPSVVAAPDLWLEAVETPPVAFIRTPVEVRVRLRARGMPPGEVAVTLLEEGQPLTSTVVNLQNEATAALVFTPTRTGRRAYRVEVDARPGEASSVNNRHQFTLSVIRDKTRVLLVAGTPTWDVKFLRRRLRQDPGIDLITFLILRTPRDLSLVPQDELSLIPFPTKELFSEELPSFDAVIFANFDYAPYVPAHYLRNIVEFVRESGGGFAMLGGDRSFGAGGYQGSPLEEILPVEISGAAPGQAYRGGGFRPRLTDTGLAHPLFQWKGRAEENRVLWNGLPELEGSNWVLRPSPGAVVLAENPEVRNEYGSQPLIVLGEYGSGRTLAVATDSLWRWALPYAGRGGEPTVYRDFWTRALRWLVHDPEMELVRLAEPPAPLRAGQRLRLRARVLDRRYRPAVGAEVSGTLSGEGAEPVPLRWVEDSPGQYHSEAVSLPAPGIWRAELRAAADGVLLGRDAVAFPVESASPEQDRIGVDLEYLSRLAEGSGGLLVRDRGRELFKLLAREGEARVEVVGRRVEEVWPRPLLLLLTVAAFAADWALRRLWQ